MPHLNPLPCLAFGPAQKKCEGGPDSVQWTGEAGGLRVIQRSIPGLHAGVEARRLRLEVLQSPCLLARVPPAACGSESPIHVLNNDPAKPAIEKTC